jgi:hypothetical protein
MMNLGCNLRAEEQEEVWPEREGPQWLKAELTAEPLRGQRYQWCLLDSRVMKAVPGEKEVK